MISLNRHARCKVCVSEVIYRICFQCDQKTVRESVWPINLLPHTEIISHLISIGHQKPPTGVTGHGVQAAGDRGKIR